MPAHYVSVGIIMGVLTAANSAGRRRSVEAAPVRSRPAATTLGYTRTRIGAGRGAAEFGIIPAGRLRGYESAYGSSNAV